ncbi:aldehyde dehydrogenase family protein [Salirhabdus salicampi]|uniref:aldehyde dehydrogenase family protein n=1 Tax=Salirhabdus salicampi TaxID=476102 RepID=UPI0020C3A90D|nr:aldehyde dehydrogenase family protein [Salirhabdus salicampi]MCP8616338.1 aldehyde dehydrogenase family protein [Salirhabdus salicampi]
MALVISKNWIGGEWSIPMNGKTIINNPSNLQEQVGTVNLSDESDVLQAEDAARKAQKKWAKLTGAARANYLNRMADGLKENLEELATLASSEMGKPIGEMKGEVNRGIHLLRYYAGEGVRSNGNVIPASDVNVMQYTKRVPIGVVGIITPWNFPVAIPIWKLAPALICGNALIWKPAEIASLTATKMVEIFEKSGLPAGVLNLVVGKGSDVGKTLLEKVNLNAVSFTGSSVTGSLVAQTCAKRNIKYQTEMGGKNAAVVMNDADLEKSIPMVLSGAFRSAGQKCTATSRIIVESGIYDEFIEKIQKGVAELNVGPALEENTYLGPVASKIQFDKVKSYVDIAHKDTTIVAEPKLSINSEGYYVSPIVVTGADSDHQLVQEEIFGPMATILKANDFDDAIRLCNKTVYGLSASLFTNNLSSAHRFLDETEAGMVRVNQETAGVEYQAPFGGMKLSSSHTREQGQAALDFYTETKTCAIKYF